MVRRVAVSCVWVRFGRRGTVRCGTFGLGMVRWGEVWQVRHGIVVSGMLREAW